MNASDEFFTPRTGFGGTELAPRNDDELRDSLRDKDPDEIREEIDRTLSSMAQTVDELKEAASREALTEKAKDVARHGAEQASRAVMRFVRSYAAPAILLGVGFGAALAIRSSARRSLALR